MLILLLLLLFIFAITPDIVAAADAICCHAADAILYPPLSLSDIVCFTFTLPFSLITLLFACFHAFAPLRYAIFDLPLFLHADAFDDASSAACYAIATIIFAIRC